MNSFRPLYFFPICYLTNLRHYNLQTLFAKSRSGKVSLLWHIELIKLILLYLLYFVERDKQRLPQDLWYVVWESPRKENVLIELVFISYILSFLSSKCTCLPMSAVGSPREISKWKGEGCQPTKCTKIENYVLFGGLAEDSIKSGRQLLK